LWPEENRKSLFGSSVNNFHCVMIAFSLPYSLIITGKLRSTILRRLFSNLATFTAFRQLTEFLLPVSRRQNHPHRAPFSRSLPFLTPPVPLTPQAPLHSSRHSKGIPMPD
jgi:hypothetical protein